MEFAKQYLKILSYVCCSLVFAFASFYLLANLYHYFELKKDFITNFSSEQLVIDIDTKINKIAENANSFNANTYKGKVDINKMSLIKNNLLQCINAINNETMQTMRTKDRITIVDVYNLRESFDDMALNDCIVRNLYWVTSVDESFGSSYLVDNKDVNKLYIDSLLSSTSYLKKDLLNNSSYYYNTAIASSSVKDNTRDGFYEVMNAYNRVADFTLYVSNWYKMEAGGAA